MSDESPTTAKVNPSEEKQIVKSALEASSTLVAGSTQFLICNKWWGMWKDYVQYDRESAPPSPMHVDGEASSPVTRPRSFSLTRGDRPGPIDNSSLCREGFEDVLRLGITENFDFQFLPAPAWQLLHERYGGGPALEREVLQQGNEVRVELFPQMLKVAAASEAGEPEGEKCMWFSRSAGLGTVYAKICAAFDKQTTAAVQVWYSAEHGEWQLLQPTLSSASASLEDLLLPDGTRVVIEEKVMSAEAANQWPFHRRTRLAMGRQSWKDPATDALKVGDKLDAQSSGAPPLSLPRWHAAEVIMAEEDRVLIALNGALKKEPVHDPVLVDGQLTPQAIKCFEHWFEEYSTDGQMDHEGLAKWVVKAAHCPCLPDDHRVLRTFTNLKRTEAGFLRMEDFLQFFKDAGATHEGLANIRKNVANMGWRKDLRHPSELTEEEKALEDGAEWFSRADTRRLAVLRTHRKLYPKPDFRDFVKQQLDFDPKGDGNWVRATLLESKLDWDVMFVTIEITATPPIGVAKTHTLPMESPLLRPPSQIYSNSTAGYGSSSSYGWSSRGNDTKGNPAVPGAVGLSNLGNTCFMNSTLQCLLHNPVLTQHFQSGQYQHEINKDNPLGHKGQVALEYAELVQKLWSGENTVVAPQSFKKTIGTINPMFAGYNQHDSSELLNWLLDGIHEDLNLVTIKPGTSQVEANGRPDAVVAQESWDTHLLRNKSVIVDNFQSQLRSQITCPDCHREAVLFEPAMFLSVPLPEATTQVLNVITVPANSANPVEHSFGLPKNTATVLDLKSAVSAKLEIPASSLVLGDCSHYSLITGAYMYKVFEDEQVISQSRGQHNFWAFEVDGLQQPGAFSVQVIQRQKSPYSTVTTHKSRTGNPSFIAVAPATCTQRELCDKVGALVRLLDPRATSEDYEICMLHSVNQYSAGTVIEPTDSLIQIDKSNTVSIDWKGNAVSPIAIQRVPPSNPAAEKGISLSQCIDKFTEEEVLGENDMWYCSGCKSHKQATKKFDLWKTAKCFIVHLKRFSQLRYGNTDFGRLERLDTVVDVPAELDVAPWLKEPSNEETVYELYGVSNHMGGMGGGHYTAYCKTGAGPLSRQDWYNFDDSRTSSVNENIISGKAAYVLFYVRKDVANGEDLGAPAEMHIDETPPET